MKIRIQEDMMGLTAEKSWFVLESYDEKAGRWGYVDGSSSCAELEVRAQRMLSESNGERFRTVKEFDSDAQT